MLLSRLGLAAANLCRINRSTCSVLQRGFAKNIEDDLKDQPIPMSQTEAATWKVAYNRMPPTQRVWYTPYVVSFSTAIFMIYFCYLREENDIDEMIYRPLPETLDGIQDLFPNQDFYTKPDYVRYHEEAKKSQEKNKQQLKTPVS